MKTLLTLLTFALALTASLEAAEEKLTYERDVRPILKAHCFQCHGEEPDPKVLEKKKRGGGCERRRI